MQPALGIDPAVEKVRGDLAALRVALLPIQSGLVAPQPLQELGKVGQKNFSARMLVIAKRGTTLPFDQQAIPRFFWSPENPADPLREFEAFIDKHLNRPPLAL